MPPEVFVRHWSSPEGLRYHERDKYPAGMSNASHRSASSALPDISQVEVSRDPSVMTSRAASTTSYPTSEGKWIHRSSPAPYERDVKVKRQRLPRVLLARLGSWRPSNAGGKGAAPATMPELYPLKTPFQQGREAVELDKRLDALKEIFAETSPRSSREWTMPARLEELSRPRVISGHKGLAFRDCAPPPEALIKKKRKPMHFPMSPKERLAASGKGAQLKTSESFADLESRLDKLLGKYDSHPGESAGASNQAAASEKRSQPSKVTEAPKAQSSSKPPASKPKAKAGAKTKSSALSSTPGPPVQEVLEAALLDDQVPESAGSAKVSVGISGPAPSRSSGEITDAESELPSASGSVGFAAGRPTSRGASESAEFERDSPHGVGVRPGEGKLDDSDPFERSGASASGGARNKDDASDSGYSDEIYEEDEFHDNEED